MANRVGKPRQAPRSLPAKIATIGDNSKHREEEERIQLISFIAKATQTAAAIEVVRAPFDAAKKAHNQVFSLAKAANPEFTRKYIEKKMEEMSRAPGENARIKAMEARHDRWLGILSPEQQQMHLEPGTPQEARDEVDWEARGYSAGLRGMEAKLPEGIPPRMDQPFMKGHGIGYAEYMKALEASVPGANRIREQAAADFAKDEPDIDVEKAARKLKKDPQFMARGAPVSPAPMSNSESTSLSATSSDDGFEATEEELAAQAGRPVHDEEVV